MCHLFDKLLIKKWIVKTNNSNFDLVWLKSKKIIENFHLSRLGFNCIQFVSLFFSLPGYILFEMEFILFDRNCTTQNKTLWKKNHANVNWIPYVIIYYRYSLKVMLIFGAFALDCVLVMSPAPSVRLIWNQLSFPRS